MLSSQEIKSFTSKILHIIESDDRAEIANLQRAASVTTEPYAYPIVLPLLPETATAYDQRAALRAAAVLAAARKVSRSTPNIPQGLTLGRWVARSTEETASTESRVRFLHTQDIDEVTLSIIRLIRLAEKSPLPLDKWDLVRTLFYWGNGISENSQTSRLRISRDYYTTSTTQKEGN